MHIYIHEHLSLTFGQGLKIILKFDIAYPQKIILSLILRAKSTSAIRKKKVIARAQDINPVLIASQIKIPLGKSLFTWKVREKREKNIWNASHLGETSIYNLRRVEDEFPFFQAVDCSCDLMNERTLFENFLKLTDWWNAFKEAWPTLFHIRHE